ncbi:MAG: DUF4386 domain-containing protein [Acidobacteria bacterium]|nr:MAG: DUF4386 domain-containing protein [Acidobacteriota bacterium]
MGTAVLTKRLNSRCSRGSSSWGDLKMAKSITETSPRLKARITGAFYLLTMLTGIFAQGFVSDRLVVSGDAAATATNILTHKSLFQLGFTIYLIEMACQIAMTVLFYYLLKPAGRIVSLLAASLGLTGCIIKTFSRVFYIAPLFVLGGAHYLNVFSLEQLQAVALLFLRVNEQGAGMALAFFGFYALLTGYLIIRSTFLPRILGWWSAGLLGATALILWLLVFGVNEQRWKEQAGAAGEWRS